MVHPERYPRDGRLIDRGARDQELDGNRDIRHKIYTGSGRRCDGKPYVLCSVGLYCCQCDVKPSLYTLEGWSYKETILVGYMVRLQYL
jgi:hypothetical protein